MRHPPLDDSIVEQNDFFFLDCLSASTSVASPSKTADSWTLVLGLLTPFFVCRSKVIPPPLSPSLDFLQTPCLFYRNPLILFECTHAHSRLPNLILAHLIASPPIISGFWPVYVCEGVYSAHIVVDSLSHSSPSSLFSSSSSLLTNVTRSFKGCASFRLLCSFSFDWIFDFITSSVSFHFFGKFSHP